MTDDLGAAGGPESLPERDPAAPGDRARPWMPPRGHRALTERLSEAEALETPPVPPTARTAVARAAPPRSAGGRGWLVLALAAIVVLLAGVVGVSVLAYSNKSRADRWEERTYALERNTDILNGLLTERSTQLSERTRELNALAAKVQRQQSALTRSESDVATLTQRQQELAAEKARLEDSRAALQVQSDALNTVANAFVECKDGLVELLGYVLGGDQASASALVDEVGSDCNEAESRLIEYRLRYG